MSDLDEVLERLVVDPLFQSALSADAATALAGYDLTPEELGLLGAPVVAGPGADHTVEVRTSKSGMVGLLGPIAAAFGVASAGGSAPVHETFGGGPKESFGDAPLPAGAISGGQSFGLLPQSDGGGPSESFGPSGTESFGAGAG